MPSGDWRPIASLEALQARARLLGQLRAFFAARGVLEVETPLLGNAIGSDPNLAPIAARYQPDPSAAERSLYLQTSPEFAMKRLLAAGSGPIWQYCKAFRNGEAGRRHNPEFTLLEWYRPGFGLAELMDEVAALLQLTLGVASCTRHSYRALFQEQLGIDPHESGAAALARLARDTIEGVDFEAEDRDFWLDLLFSHHIEPRLRGAHFIYHYPASQAALARLVRDQQGCTVAARFELVVDGMELANGYHELLDPREQAQRFAEDQYSRERRGLPRYPTDTRLLAALEAGLPDCAGVALGVDRLLMLMLGTRDIADVLAFPLDRA